MSSRHVILKKQSDVIDAKIADLSSSGVEQNAGSSSLNTRPSVVIRHRPIFHIGVLFRRSPTRFCLSLLIWTLAIPFIIILFGSIVEYFDLSNVERSVRWTMKKRVLGFVMMFGIGPALRILPEVLRPSFEFARELVSMREWPHSKRIARGDVGTIEFAAFGSGLRVSIPILNAKYELTIKRSESAIPGQLRSLGYEVVGPD